VRCLADAEICALHSFEAGYARRSSSHKSENGRGLRVEENPLLWFDSLKAWMPRIRLKRVTIAAGRMRLTH
jgi:hypothetical protein